MPTSTSSSKPVTYQSLTELRQALDSGKLTSTELTQACINRTKELEPKLHAFLSYNEAKSLEAAKASDERRKKGTILSPLDGIPVSIKDMICQEGVSNTCASNILKDFISPYDAHVIEKLKKAGAILWGRTNMDEFAMGSSNESSAFGACSNPWNTDCVPGGSSGGSAVAVTAGQTVLSLGTDTGGSIRQPAALCGIVGLKPSYGLISRYGITAYASSLDQAGPFARTVEDCAHLLHVIAGHDERDSTSFPTDIPNYPELIKKNKGPWTIGVPKEYFAQGLDPEIKSAVEAAIQFYKSIGCKIVDVTLPNMHLAIPIYYVIACAEASSNLARYDGIRYTHRTSSATNAIDIFSKSRDEGFGPEIKRRIILGTFVLSSGYYDAYYLRAQKIRRLIRNDFDNAFKSVDALITPITPSVAFKKGSKSSDPLAMYLEDIFTVSINLAGVPAISIPCGMHSSKLPIGMQLIGKPFQEADILSMAHTFEEAHNYKNNHPNL